MNKIKCIRLMFLTLIIFPVFVSGQWTTSGTSIYNTNTGNVGIGTNNPDRTLAVSGQLGLSGASPAVVFKYVGSSTKVWDIASLGNDLSINETGILSRFVLRSGGNVGIGIAEPSAKLHVNASLTEAAIKIGSPNVAGNLNVPVGASTGGYNIDFYTWRDIEVDQIGARVRAERINSYLPNNALVQSMDLAFYTSIGGVQSDLTERLRINGVGNVSIGTKDSKGYKLAVNGSILATEIKVQAIPWPDYVFSKSYNLPTLQSVEKHVKEEGYLPDMPSAKEVESNGINVGEMNGKLLKKIEELTLYLIDLDKKVDKLDAENKELKELLFNGNVKIKKVK